MKTRREFLGFGLTAGGSLLLVSALPGCSMRGVLQDVITKDQSLKSIYLEVTADNKFYLTFDKSEMGQGVITGQATLFGEEADIHPSSFIMRPAMADPRYASEMGHMMTSGSSSTPQRFDLLRQVAASYRSRVRLAAASHWQVPLSEVMTDNGYVVNQKSKSENPMRLLMATS